MMRLKDESFFLHVGQPVALEFDRIKETANALYFDKGFVDFRCYGELWIKCHCWHLYNFPMNALPNINLRCLTPQILSNEIGASKVFIGLKSIASQFRS